MKIFLKTNPCYFISFQLVPTEKFYYCLVFFDKNLTFEKVFFKINFGLKKGFGH